MAIIGILAALAMPVVNNFKPNYSASVTRQLLDALSRGRQLAISQRTTVYMVFVPTNFWNDPAYSVLPNTERAKALKLLDKQCIGYNYVTLRSLGDQPGRPTVRYLDSWRTLPEGGFIPLPKFAPNNKAYFIETNSVTGVPIPAFVVRGFDYTSSVPFPSEDAARYVYNRSKQPYVTLPYIAFDYMGRLTSGRDEVIPLAKGSVSFSRGPDKTPLSRLPSFLEQPPGNSTNSASYSLVYVNWLTGRARVFQQEVR
jgi:hypothetical protein